MKTRMSYLAKVDAPRLATVEGDAPGTTNARQQAASSAVHARNNTFMTDRDTAGSTTDNNLLLLYWFVALRGLKINHCLNKTPVFQLKHASQCYVFCRCCCVAVFACLLLAAVCCSNTHVSALVASALALCTATGAQTDYQTNYYGQHARSL